MVNQFLMFVAAITNSPPLVTLLQRDGYFFVTQGEKTLANQTHTGDFQSQHPSPSRRCRARHAAGNGNQCIRDARPRHVRWGHTGS
jgi:hypothetical protein